MILPGERDAMQVCIGLADEYGYGNLIDRLRAAWAVRLMESNSTVSVLTACSGALMDRPHANRMAFCGRESGLKCLREYALITPDSPADQGTPEKGQSDD